MFTKILTKRADKIIQNSFRRSRISYPIENSDDTSVKWCLNDIEKQRKNYISMKDEMLDSAFFDPLPTFTLSICSTVPLIPMIIDLTYPCASCTFISWGATSIVLSPFVHFIKTYYTHSQNLKLSADFACEKISKEQRIKEFEKLTSNKN